MHKCGPAKKDMHDLDDSTCIPSLLCPV